MRVRVELDIWTFDDDTADDIYRRLRAILRERMDEDFRIVSCAEEVLP